MPRIKNNPDCELCPLHTDANSVCLMGRGPLDDAKGMVIGEAPGLQEDKTGKPFQGKAGQLLNKLFMQHGLDRDEFYVSNTVKCRPPDNRTPKPKEITACSIYLQKELKRVDTKFVLLLGSTAVKGQLGDVKITEIRGQFIEQNGRVYFATFHPAAALRDPKKEKVISTDIARFALAIKTGKIPSDDDGLNLRIVKSVDDFNECIDDLAKSKSIAYDLETTGLKPFEPGAEVVCIGLAAKDIQWVVPLYHKESPFKTKETRQMVMDCIHETIADKYLIAHNAKFDSLWLKTIYGLEFKCRFDTMLAHYLLDENDSHGLKYLASQFLGAAEYDISSEDKSGVNTKLDKLAKYCAKDVLYTRKLKKVFGDMMVEDESLWDLFNMVIMPASNAYTVIEHNGVWVYEGRLDQAEQYWKDILNECYDRLDHYLIPYQKHWPKLSLRIDPTMATYNAKGKKKSQFKKKDEVGAFKWGSTKQVADLFFNKMGMKVLEKSGKGAPSTNESVMLRLAAEHEVARDLLTYREAYKQLSSFIESWKNKIVDSRLHPSFKLHGAVTGRTSCVEPNLQQVPRDPRIRTLLGAPPGWTMIEADQSQVELRVAAIVSGEDNMKHAFQVGEDLHTKTAQATTGKQKLTKEERKKAKAQNFGFLYGMGWRKFIIYARDNYGAIFSEPEARAVRERFFETYPGLKPWHDKQRNIARMYGQVRSLVGRVRHLPNVNSEDEMEQAAALRQAINSPVQGFASDLILMAVVELTDKFENEYFKIAGTVHDAILMEIRNDKLHEIVPQIKSTMEKPKILTELGVVLPLPLVADVTIGDWGGGSGVHFGNTPPLDDEGQPDIKKLWFNTKKSVILSWSKEDKAWVKFIPDPKDS